MMYDIYHDESQENGFWHGILLVPQNTRKQLLNYLETIRRETNYNSPITFKGLKQKGRRSECIRMWIEVGINALIQDLKGKGYPKIHLRQKTYSKSEKRQATDFFEIIRMEEPIKAKFILFRERDCHKTMESTWFPDHAAKIETTFRFGLKGGLHLLFDENESAHITSIHFDGCEHYKRRIDKRRVVYKLREGLRDYCRIEDNIDDRTSKHNKNDSQDYDDCQLLQLTDLLIGAFRTALSTAKNDIQREVSWMARDLVQKWREGPARMKNSRWYKGFCISECYLEKGKWQFNNLIADVNLNEEPLLF